VNIDSTVQLALTIINVLLVPLALKTASILWDHERRIVSIEGRVDNATRSNDRV
jgi:hypothetical protein